MERGENYVVEMLILRSKRGLQVLGAHTTDWQSSAADAFQMPSCAETGQEPRPNRLNSSEIGTSVYDEFAVHQ